MTTEVPSKSAFYAQIDAAVESSKLAEQERDAAQACRTHSDISYHAVLAFQHARQAAEHMLDAMRQPEISDPGVADYCSKLFEYFIQMAESMYLKAQTNGVNADFAKVTTHSTVSASAINAVGARDSAVSVPADLPMPSYPDDPRWRAAYELLTTERTYVRCVNALIRAYKNPLMPLDEDDGGLVGRFLALFGGPGADDSMAPHTWLTHDEHQHIFRDIDTIKKFHEEYMLPELERCMANWSPNTCVGPIISQVAPFFKMCKQYFAGYGQAQQLISRITSENSDFAAFLQRQALSDDSLHFDIFSHLIRPIQRMTQYSVLLHEILKSTPVEHPDHQQTSNAAAAVAATTSEMNEACKVIEAQNNVYKAAYDFFPPHLELIQPHRRLLKQGTLDMLPEHGRRTVQLYLFNDIYVIGAQKMWPGGQAVLVSAEVVDALTDASADEALRLAGGTGYPFNIYGQESSTTLVAPSDQIRREWLDMLQVPITERVRARSKSLLPVAHFARHSAEHVASDPLMDSILEGLEVSISESGPVILSPLSSSSQSVVTPLAHAAPIHVPDAQSSTCQICDAAFNFVHRRHHCRNCGKLVCRECSRSSMKLKHTSEPVRVCDTCVAHFTNLAGQAVPFRPVSSSFVATVAGDRSSIRTTNPRSFATTVTAMQAKDAAAPVQNLDQNATEPVIAQPPLLLRVASEEDPSPSHMAQTAMERISNNTPPSEDVGAIMQQNVTVSAESEHSSEFGEDGPSIVANEEIDAAV